MTIDERRMSNQGILSILFVKKSKATSTIRQSSFHVVSHERRLWPEKFTRLGRAASLIEKET